MKFRLDVLSIDLEDQQGKFLNYLNVFDGEYPVTGHQSRRVKTVELVEVGYDAMIFFQVACCVGLILHPDQHSHRHISDLRDHKEAPHQHDKGRLLDLAVANENERAQVINTTLPNQVEIQLRIKCLLFVRHHPRSLLLCTISTFFLLN